MWETPANRATSCIPGGRACDPPLAVIDVSLPVLAGPAAAAETDVAEIPAVPMLGRHAQTDRLDDVRPDSQFMTAVRLLLAASEVITAAQADNRIRAVLIDGDADDLEMSLGDLTITARHGFRLLRRMLLDVGVELPVLDGTVVNERKSGSHHFDPADHRPFGIVIATGDDELLLIGQGFTVDFELDEGLVEIDQVIDQRIENGILIDGRVLNGDERLEILPLDGVGAARVRLLRSTRDEDLER